MLNTKTAKTIIALFFTLTGATGLIYQISWFKYISLFLGNTTYAQMIVLATFLGGLSIGNYYFGKKSESLKNPIMFYGIMELMVGIYCLAYPAFSLTLGDVFISAAKNMNVESQNFIFIAAKFLFTSSLLLLPTIAMGGTLPLVSKYFITSTSNVRKELGILYFLNSFGAVIGILLAGFFLIQAIGLNSTTYLTAMINIAVGSLAIIVSKMISKQNEEIEEKEEDEEIIVDKSVLKIITMVAGISGMAALLYEVVWVRLLVNFLGSSTYAFSIMLLAFITGITSGSFIVSLGFVKKYNKIKLVVFLQSFIAIGTMVSLVFYEKFPYYLWQVASLLNRSEASFKVFLTIEFLFCFILMMIPTIFMGMSLPVIVDVVSNSTKKIGISVGNIFSINTIGTVVGVLITSLFLIPNIGIKGSFEVGIGLNLLSAIILFFAYEKTKIKSKLKLATSLILLFVLFLILFPAWNVNTLVQGVFRHLKFEAPKSMNEYREKINQDSILFYKEGISANVAVLKRKNGIQKRLIINGKADASSVSDMPTQVLLGQLPTLLHNDPKNAFIVGFGSGSTVGSVLTHDIEKVTCVEMNKGVIEAAEHFKEVNNDCLEDSRLNLVIEDALTYLKMTKEKYDVIISEPSNPWIAGIGNLFSEEYFSLAKSKLNDDGIMVQWFHLYELNDEILKLVISTFKKVFPEVQIWNSLDVDILLVGSKKKLNIKFEKMQEKLNSPKIKADLKRIGINNLFTLLSLQKLSNEGAFKLTNFHRINSELHPILEFIAPKSFYMGLTSGLIKNRDEKFSSYKNKLLINKYIVSQEPSLVEISNAVDYHLNKTHNFNFAFGLSKFYLEKYPHSYKLREQNYNAKKNLGSQFPEKELMSLVDIYPDTSFVKREKRNNLIRENLLSTTFLKTYKISPIVKEIIDSKKEGDIKSLVKTIENSIDILIQNGEMEYADTLAREIKKYFKDDNNLSDEINLKRYLFNACRLSILFRNDMDFLGDFKVLGEFYPNDDYLIELKKYFLIDQNKRKKERESLNEKANQSLD